MNEKEKKDLRAQMTSAKSNLPPPKKYKYRSMQGGGFETKPEFMTQLYGEELVFKDHPIIILRGTLDCFEAKLLEMALHYTEKGCLSLAKALQEILQYVRNLLRCEVLHVPVEDCTILGWTEEEIHQRSHFPKKYYNMHHFMPTCDHGELVLKLNSLRAETRRIEIVAYQAFKNVYGIPERQDILQGLNRLSSLFYVMMFEAVCGHYEN